jgi:hypothetical protein
VQHCTSAEVLFDVAVRSGARWPCALKCGVLSSADLHCCGRKPDVMHLMKRKSGVMGQCGK